MTPSTHQTPRRRGARIVAGIALAIVVSSCSGADDVSEPVEPNSTPPSDVTAPTTPAVEPTTSTTDPTTTTTSVAADPTTTIDSAPPTTIEGPPDTIYDPTTTEGQIEQAVLNSGAAYERCIDDFATCDIEDVLTSTTGDYREGLRRNLEDWRLQGYGVTNSDSYSFAVEEVIVEPQEPVSLATWCVVDRSIIFEAATDGAPERIIDDSSASFRVQLQLDLIENEWLISASEVLDRSDSPEENTCA